jgi:expansin (peptidoglycan-binding protein)
MATHYTSTDGGNCSLPAAPADHLDVALSHDEYGTADACGGYLDVVGPDGSVRVVITNQCPECPVGHLDLSEQAFARIGRLEAGQVPVTYSLVRNPPLDRPISIRVKTGSSQWWMQIQALDHGNPIASFELATGGGWRSLVHSNDNFWTAENPGPGPGPFTVRITDIFGQSTTIDGIAMAPDQVQRTDARLYGDGAGSGTASAPTPAPAPATTAPPATTPPKPDASFPPPPATTVPHAAGPAGEVAVAETRTSSSGRGDGERTGVSLAVAATTAAALGAGALVLRRRRPAAPGPGWRPEAPG